MKINIIHAKKLEPTFNFYVKNSPNVKGEGWKEWNPPSEEVVVERIKAYQEIWDKYETKILAGIQSALNLDFKNDIEVSVVAGTNRSTSYPIVISSHHSPRKFIVELAHELIHRIFEGTDFKFDAVLEVRTHNKVIDNHVLVYAVLRQIFANEPKFMEIISNIKNPDYLKAFEMSENYAHVLNYFRAHMV